MIEFFTEMQGRYRLIWGLVLIGINLILLFFVGVVWLWLWDCLKTLISQSDM